MDGIINIKAFGSHISKDSQTAGVRGEAGVSYLRITFDESWDGFAKRVVFWDAQGKNPVARTLVAHEPEDVRLFIVDIPGEALAVAGKMTFVIDGMVEDKLKRRVTDTLVVKESPADDEPVEPSPDEFVAIRQDIENLRGDIQQAYESEEQAEEYKNKAKEYSEDAEGHKENAYRYSMNALTHWNYANDARKEAEQFAAKAYNAIGKVPFVGENGNWFAWEGNGETFYDTGVRAQSGATVYYGKNPPAEADIWIDPDGESSMSAPYIGENGNWYTFDEESQTFKDSGKPSVDEDVREMLNIMRSDVEYNRMLINNLNDNAVSKRSYVTIYGGADNWTAEAVTNEVGETVGYRYGQVVNVNNAVITPNSKVDLQVTSEQMVVFYEKDLAFVAENEDGVVTVYCVGNVPEHDYTIQAIVTEVV